MPPAARRRRAGWGIRRAQIRVGGFEVGQPAVERVVFLVGDGGRGVLVVALVVPGDFEAQGRDFLPDGLGRGCWEKAAWTCLDNRRNAV